jgi:hypothetical protein
MLLKKHINVAIRYLAAFCSALKEDEAQSLDWQLGS